MRIVALMAWFDEQPATLTRAVRSAADSGVTHLVAVDGSYAMIPNPAGTSPPEQKRAIEQAARIAGIQCAVFDGRIWENEILKRDFMFRASDNLAGLDDWLLILDADFEVKGNLRKAITKAAWSIEAAPRPIPRVLNCLLTTPDGPTQDLRYGVAPIMMFRAMYRGGQGIKVEGNHYSYTAADGARLWGSALGLPPLEVPVTMDDIEIMHWTYFRDPERVARQISYYQERDRKGIERGPCYECGVTSTCFVPINPVDLGDSVDTRFAEACDKCAPKMIIRSRLQYVKLGGEDPQQLRIVKPV